MVKMKTARNDATVITAAFCQSATGSQRLNKFATLLLGWMLTVMNFGRSQEANARPVPKIASQKPRLRHQTELGGREPHDHTPAKSAHGADSVYMKMLRNSRLLAAIDTLLPVLLHESVTNED